MCSRSRFALQARRMPVPPASAVSPTEPAAHSAHEQDASHAEACAHRVRLGL